MPNPATRLLRTVWRCVIAIMIIGGLFDAVCWTIMLRRHSSPVALISFGAYILLILGLGVYLYRFGRRRF